MHFQCKILLVVLLIHVGVLAKSSGNRHILMKRSFVQTIHNFLKSSECQIDELADILTKAEEKDQALNSSCDSGKWQALIKPIYVSLHNETSKVCDELKAFITAAHEDASILDHLCFSKTHVMQCSIKSKECECLHLKDLGNSRKHTHESVRHNHHESHKHNENREHSSNGECLIESHCEGQVCTGNGSKARATGLSWLSALMILIFGFRMA